MTRKELKSRIREYDTMRWEQGLLGAKTQVLYFLGKQKMGYDMCYRNTYNSTFLAKARLNALKLEDQISRGKHNYDKTCKLCGLANEDMIHFLIDCPYLEADRNPSLIDQNICSSQDKMINLLFNSNNFIDVGIMIRKMWHRRRKLLAFQKKQIVLNMPPNRVNRTILPPPLSTLNSDPRPMRVNPISFPGNSV